MTKSRAFVVTTILPDDAVIVDDPKLQTPGNVTFRSTSTKELFWLDKKIWNCHQNHEASHYYCCEICHPHLKGEYKNDR